MNEIEKIIPNKIPFKCVVCNGWGTVSSQRVECHACKGKGYILVENTDRDKDYED